MFRRLTSTMTLLLLLLSVAAAPADNPPNSVQVKPEGVAIGIFYSGQKVHVKVAAPASGDVVMRIAGAEEPLLLKRKGKKYGFLWMKVGEVHYEAVPILYFLCSSRSLDGIAPPQTLDRLKLGFDALKDRIPAGTEGGARELFGELVKLKEHDHLFSYQPTGVRLHDLGAGRQEAEADFFLPAKTPVGDYTVDVFGFRAQQGKLLGTATIHVKRTSTVSWIASLAANHGLLYGCLAVVIAVLAGLFTGFLFSR